jgi:agmatine/peptidylarginine deiminase
MKRLLIVLALLVFVSWSLFAQRVSLSSEDNSLHILQSSPQETILQYRVTQFDTKETTINGEKWFQLSMPGEGVTQEKGLPELPVFNRSIIIDNSARMKLEIFDIEYTDMRMPIAPSKGVITRDIDPKTVPYTFDAVYSGKDFHPNKLAELSDPYIMRDFRGVTIRTIPFAYKPDTKTLRVYHSYKIRVYQEGIDTINVLQQSRSTISRAFAGIYQNHFVNWNNYRYTPLDDSYGKLLVICHTSFMNTIQPWVNWKLQKGVETEVVQWSTIGTTAAQLQTFIQNRYNQDNTLTYVQIVGDAPQIPTLTSGGGGSDPTFSLVAGGDNYPDIFIGRFSAENESQLTVQLNRSIAYERDLNTTDTWLTRATGIASSEGGGSQGDNGESDIQHMNIIRTKLLNYGYTSVDQIYDPGASATTVSNNVNAGRGFINYVGHGSDTAWSTTGFSVTNAMNLTNGNMVPFIVDVACVNGNFVSMTCFAEGWMRSPNGGAITIYASTINQSWNSPMRAQDEITDLWIADAKNTTGGYYYSGSCKMMDVYGNTTGSDGVNMFKTWHIFGDASLMVRSKTPIAMNPSHPTQIPVGSPTMNITNAAPNSLVSLTYNNQIYARGFANSSGSLSLSLSGLPVTPQDYTITITAYNRVTYVGTVQLIPASGPYVGVESTQYADTNNQSPDYNESGTFNVTIKNMGSAAATSLNATLSTSTVGISITDANEALGNLAAGATITRNNAFAFNIANNIADGAIAAFTITMTSGTESWTHDFSITVNAPALSFGSFTMVDPTGNNNGRLDPGETVTITMPILNTGGAASPTGTATLSSSTPGITINTGTVNFASIAAGGSNIASFSVSAAAGMSIGTIANFSFNAVAGAYSASKNESLPVGLILENFESGNFNSYPWEMAGTLPWTVVNTGAYEGTYAAKSGAISHDQTSTMRTSRVLTNPGSVSFRYKVSSESGYDYLRFFVDGVQQAQWSGTVDWTEATYNLAAGTRELTWTYLKDSSVSSGSDCAWIDNIIFPASTAPSTFYPPQNLSAIPADGSVTLNWQAPTGTAPTSYQIYKDGSLLTSVSALTYQDNAVTNGVTYTYYVKSVFPGGTSDPSNIVEVIAGEVTEAVLGSGTLETGTSDASPINIWYKSLHGQSVYTANELNAAGVFGPVEITQLGFNITALPAMAMPNYVVRMKHTAASNVASWIDSSNFTTVYTNASYLPAQTGWNLYTLSTPFMWNGTDNILIDTAFGLMADYDRSGTVQYSTVTSGYRYVRDDYTNQTNVFTDGTVATTRPNLKLVFNQTGIISPNIAVSPTSISETVSIGNSVSRNITISNTGTADLVWSIQERDESLAAGLRSSVNKNGREARPADWYSINTLSGTINPGANTIVTITLDSNGLAAGTYTSSFSINSNAENNPSLSVPLSLTVETLVNPFPVEPRFVAEWEPASGAIVRYPFGQPYSLLRDLSQDALLYVIVTSASQPTANSNLQSNGVNMANVRYINAASDSYWVRDYGPWTIFDADHNMHLVNFNYNRPRPSDNLIPSVVAGYLGKSMYDLDMNHTGGNMMTDGMGKAMSTELVLSENSSLSPAQINQRFSDFLGVTEYQIYTDPTNTYIDHIDCWAKLLDVDKVLIRRVPAGHAQYNAIEQSVTQWQSKTSSYGTPYRIFRVDTPNDEPYTNSFIMNGNIYVPQMGTAYDAQALAVYQSAMPGFTVRGYTHTNYQSTDALHCRVNTIFDDQLIAVRHTPPANLMAYTVYSFSVDIDHSNALDTAGSFIAWSTSSSGPWQQISLSAAGLDSWTANLSLPAAGTLYYYIRAQDSSGRTTLLPLCAELDPFEIQILPNPALPDWTPVSYANPPAMIHAEVTVMGNPAQVGDLVGAFVGDECRGSGFVFSNRNNMVSLQIQLAESGETVKFKVFSQTDELIYDADLELSPGTGEILGSDIPLQIICGLAQPVVNISLQDGEIHLSWDHVPHATYYQLGVSDNPLGGFTPLFQTVDNHCSIPVYFDIDRWYFIVIAVKDN